MNGIESKKKQIELEFSDRLISLYLNLEQVARMCRVAALNNNQKNIFIGEGNFTNFCKQLKESGYSYLEINKYLTKWKKELFVKIK